jgi:hypothetical protein
MASPTDGAGDRNRLRFHLAPRWENNDELLRALLRRNLYDSPHGERPWLLYRYDAIDLPDDRTDLDILRVSWQEVRASGVVVDADVLPAGNSHRVAIPDAPPPTVRPPIGEHRSANRVNSTGSPMRVGGLLSFLARFCRAPETRAYYQLAVGDLRRDVRQMLKQGVALRTVRACIVWRTAGTITHALWDWFIRTSREVAGVLALRKPGAG